MWAFPLRPGQYAIQGSPLPGVTQYAAPGGSPPATQSIQDGGGRRTIPIRLVYPFLQKYFTKGVLTGASNATEPTARA
jgi:hypothetical protein